MAPADLLCLYCHAPAFAVVNVELAQGRGRWPTCRSEDCLNRGLFDAGIRLANAAGLHVVNDAAVPGAIDTTASDAPPVKIAGYLDASQQWIDALPDA